MITKKEALTQARIAYNSIRCYENTSKITKAMVDARADAYTEAYKEFVEEQARLTDKSVSLTLTKPDNQGD